MSFQSYITNIKAKTGKTPDDFRELAEEKGLLDSDATATQVFEWLKKDYGLGLGHARAVWHLLKPYVKRK